MSTLEAQGKVVSLAGKDLVQLNVGGKLFQTARATLAESKCYLARLVNGDIPSSEDGTGALFIDRSYEHFDTILTYLRDGVVHFDRNEKAVKDLLHEAQYYKIEPLVDKIMEYEKLRAPTVDFGGENITQIVSKNEELTKRIAALESEKASVPSTAEESKKIAQFFKNKYQKELDELKNKLAQYEPLHPSDTTRVARFEGYNLLDEAREDELVNQAVLDIAGNVKEDSEQIKALQRQLKQVTQEYEESDGLHKALALQYREGVRSLTGYQIKMHPEGIFEAENFMDQGGMLCFQIKDNSIDLLENDSPLKWKTIAEKYLGKYKSFPAFLAAITLDLVENTVQSGSNSFNNP